MRVEKYFFCRLYFISIYIYIHFPSTFELDLIALDTRVATSQKKKKNGSGSNSNPDSVPIILSFELLKFTFYFFPNEHNYTYLIREDDITVSAKIFIVCMRSRQKNGYSQALLKKFIKGREC